MREGLGAVSVAYYAFLRSVDLVMCDARTASGRPRIAGSLRPWCEHGRRPHVRVQALHRSGVQ
eukprot:12167593-Alexandrium_andersonii.AAC.1